MDFWKQQKEELNPTDKPEQTAKGTRRSKFD